MVGTLAYEAQSWSYQVLSNEYFFKGILGVILRGVDAHSSGSTAALKLRPDQNFGHLNEKLILARAKYYLTLFKRS